MTGEEISSTKSILGLSLCLSVLFLSCTSVFGAKRKSTMEIPEGLAGIVAYGSLISLTSMEQTLGHKYQGPINQIHLTGYERAWTCVRPWNDPQAKSADIKRSDAFFLRGNERVPITGAAELNIYPKKKGRINAILYLVSNAEVISLDKRESGYRRVDVTDKIEEFQFRGGKVYVYEGLPRRTDGSSTEKGTYVLIKEFVDSVTGACDAIGKNFRDEFDKSTRPCAYQVVSYKEIVREKAK
ncbi:MAG: gamma-glutamylcyclotransferase family protein [Candidatus Aminicenantales bacterium]